MLSEKEFLSQYHMEDYERPSVTADIVAFMIRTEEEESFRKEPRNRLGRGPYSHYRDHGHCPEAF